MISQSKRKISWLVYVFASLVFLLFGAAIFVPKVSSHNESKTASASSDEAILAGYLHQFKHDCGRYPTTEEGFGALRRAPVALIGKAREPYLPMALAPTDPWGRTYAYELKAGGSSFTITSLGADGTVGGEGEDEDVVDNEVVDQI